jgi:uncharacterized protein HemY
VLLLIVAVIVFLAAAAGDFVEAYYTRAVADREPVRAGLMSCLMYAVSLAGFLAVLKLSVWLVIPELFGVGLGAWFAVRRQKRAHDRARAEALAAGVLVEPDAQFWPREPATQRYVA